MYRYLLKRVFDLIISIIVFGLCMPVIILTAISLTIVNKGTPFFIQKRPGLFGATFNLIKFKTMTDAVDVSGDMLSDEMRLTRVGKLVRRFSIDETLQLINVIKGDMSIVGPRPLLTEYLTLYNKYQSRRHEVKPGITGWAQVNGRNSISWESKFNYDVWYVDNMSFFLDIKIIALTGLKIFNTNDVNAAKGLTMEKFKGNL